MAITGLVVMPAAGMGPDALRMRLEGLEGLSCFGGSEDGSLVYVLEAPASELESRLRGISEMEGVGVVLPTSVNMEDELEADGDA
ncbi:hypothetical protein [Fundidesulfovibrio agrisoli]|uniref:hypothetical protein n=1 Tax=Fundidesulfovibrio agrisoli TaxID=2922717 RepID=UPI001FAC5E5E|nr:hypothetical protein [Fundidesulfovibrio agrisoli]